MRFRKTLVAVVAAVGALSSTFIGAGAAEARAIFVGGGAAAVEVNVHRVSRFFNRFSRLEQEIPLALPAVQLPPEGNPGSTPITAELAGYETNGIGAHVLHATTDGNLDGTPYARSTASVGAVNIPGSNIRAVHSECNWDASGPPTATTTIVDVAGTAYTPAPNTRINLPGYGYIILNEQYERDVWVDSSDRPARVIVVKGIHVYLDRYGRNDSYTSVDVALAYASCDPLTIPGLSGLKLLGLSSD